MRVEFVGFNGIVMRVLYRVKTVGDLVIHMLYNKQYPSTAAPLELGIHGTRIQRRVYRMNGRFITTS